MCPHRRQDEGFPAEAEWPNQPIERADQELEVDIYFDAIECHRCHDRNLALLSLRNRLRSFCLGICVGILIVVCVLVEYYLIPIIMNIH